MQTQSQVGVGSALRDLVPVSNCVLADTLMLFFPELLTIQTCHIILLLKQLLIGQVAPDWPLIGQNMTRHDIWTPGPDSVCHDVTSHHTSGKRMCQSLTPQLEIELGPSSTETSGGYLLKLKLCVTEEGPVCRLEMGCEQVLELEGRKSPRRSCY